jgi:hypothetical protein
MTSRLWAATKSGLVYPLSSGGGGGPGAGWSPSSASVALVSTYDISDASKLFTDNAGTAPASDTNHIGCVKDPVSGFDVTTVGGTVATVGPVYHAGAKPYLQFNIGGEYLATPVTHQYVNATDGTHTFGLAMVPTDVTGTQYLVKAGSQPKGLVLNSGVSAFVAKRSDGFLFTDNGATLTVGTSYSLIGVATGTTVEMFVNGVSAGSTSLAGTGLDLSAFGITFSDATAGYRLYWAGFWAGAFNSTDRGNLDTYQLAKLP